MLRKLTLGAMVLAMGALTACHDGHHPRDHGPGPGYDHGGDRGDHGHGNYRDGPR